MPTDVVPGSSRVSRALIAASSTIATTRGVARTGTSPDPSAMAVSSSVTASRTSAVRPGSKCTGLRYAPSESSAKPGECTEGEPVLEESVIQRVLGTALRTGGEFAEIFVEDKRSSSARLDDGKIEELSSGRDRGAGIRVIVGDTTGFAHTADLSESGLRSAAEAAAAAARGGGGGERIVDLTRITAPAPNAIKVQPEDIAKSAKVALLTRADGAARAEGGAIKQVSARVADSR